RFDLESSALPLTARIVGVPIASPLCGWVKRTEGMPTPPHSGTTERKTPPACWIRNARAQLDASSDCRSDARTRCSCCEYALEKVRVTARTGWRKIISQQIRTIERLSHHNFLQKTAHSLNVAAVNFLAIKPNQMSKAR